MLNVLLNTKDDVIVIDPEAEYRGMAQMLHGEVIRIAKGSDVYINPMDMNMSYAGDNDDPLSLKVDFMISLCEAIAQGELTPVQMSLIDKCVKKSYREYIHSYNPVTKKVDDNLIPTLLDFKRILEQERGPDARYLADCLTLYTEGTLDTFAHPTNVDYNNRFVVYNIRDMGTNLKSLGLLIVLDNIWNRILENQKKGRFTWIYIDEIYLLFKTRYSATFFMELWKRSRKYGGVCTGITQNVQDIINNEIANTMIANSEFIQMLSQGYQDKLILAEFLDISETNLGYISNSTPGEGLLYVGNSSIVPFVNRFPTDTSMYQALSSKMKEI